jgi:serine/threonine protein kinase
VKLGRYEVVRELGKGAMGIVYLAKDPLIGRLVALKTIRVAAHADDDEAKEFQQRFIREAQAAGILNHPSIVTVHDIGQDDNSAVSFIAMEYVEGNNLKEVLAQGRAMTFEQLADIIAQVAEALDFAHAKGIVHRDVKPANIILIDGNRAKITDFGIAKIASGGANLTTTGQFLGTPNYMAPEQIKGAPVDGRTDIFSLGICFYECLTRRKPFGGDSLTSISYKIVHEPFPPLHEINPQIPEGFEEVVGMCLAKDPAKRYQRGKDLAASIRAVIRGERPTRPMEPMFADETIVTRDRERTPTVEIPFPDAAPAAPAPLNTVSAARTAPTPAVPGSGAQTRPIAGRPPAAIKRTMADVSAHPVWKYPMPPALFFGAIALFAMAMLASVVSIKNATLPPPVIDRVTEGHVKRQHALRMQGNAALRGGRVADAYTAFSQLQKLAPHSPYVNHLMERLSAVRQQEELSNQQLALARQKFDQGLVLYNQKKYTDAIPLFQESFHINPNFEDAGNYLRLAQQQEEGLKQAKLLARRPPSGTTSTRYPANQTTATGSAPTATQAPANVAPAQFTTFFNGGVTDGDIIVRVGQQIVVRESLWQESGRSIFRRKQPRVININHDVPAADSDVEVWVTIPSMQVKEYHSLRQNFQPGSSHRLVITFDRQTRRFDYQLN